MVNPAFAARALKAIKKMDNVSVGYDTDPKDWVSTGNYLLNYMISGDFFKGIPLGLVTMLYGESGAAKSFLAASIIKNAQSQGIYCVYIDTEYAVTHDNLVKLGVDPEFMLLTRASNIDTISAVINQLINEYKTDGAENRGKLLIVVDSLGMVVTPTDEKQFRDNEISKGDMGRKPKALYALVRNCVNSFGNLNIGMVATNHSYQSQDPYSPDDKVSGGGGFVYAGSIIVGMKKKKLKEDEEGNKIKEVRGVRVGCKVTKTRFTKPFEECEMDIPWETGLNPYSGLFEFLYEKKQAITRTGNQYLYVDLSGKEHKYFKKEYLLNTDGIYDLIMKEFEEKIKASPKVILPTIDE